MWTALIPPQGPISFLECDVNLSMGCQGAVIAYIYELLCMLPCGELWIPRKLIYFKVQHWKFYINVCAWFLTAIGGNCQTSFSVAYDYSDVVIHDTFNARCHFDGLENFHESSEQSKKEGFT